jgi:hypothetical protein
MTSSVAASIINEILSKGGFPFKSFLSKQLGEIIANEVPRCRERIYTPEVTLFGMIYEALDPNSSLRKTVIRNNADRISMGKDLASINTAAYSKARSRLPIELITQATKQAATDSQKEAPNDWKWNDMDVMAIDGSTVTANDTPENQKAFPQHGKQIDGVGFPILRLVILQSLTTGMIHDLSFGAYKGKKTGEMALARNIIDSLTPNSLLLGDRYYPSYFLICELSKKGINGLFQSHAARSIDFRTGENLGSLDHISYWKRPLRPSWMTIEEYNSYPDSIKIREVDITEEVGTQDKFIVVTTLLDNKIFSKHDLSDLYLKRWGIELALRNLKDSMGMHHLNVQTPEMIEKTLWSYITAFNTVRWYMANAALFGNTRPENISYSATYNIVDANKANLLNTTGAKQREILASMFYQMITVKVGNRPGRSEPRAVKKRRKPHKLLSKPRKDYGLN